MLFICDHKELKLLGQNSVVYFYAQNVFQHKKMMIMLELAEKANKNKNFYAVDIDYFQNLAKIFDIESLPTVIVTNADGKEVNRIVGLTKTKDFVSQISSIH